MKQLLLISGLSLLSTAAFSQHISSERKVTITPVPTEEKAPKENTTDSVVVNSMGRMSKPVIQVEPVMKETQAVSNTNKPGQVTTINSSAKKPE
ncbi:hypothetical protein [Fluviicola sp.]|uniref:hypothetical protein n=1 Tax=Fluviicola sp. TaxID=1917219 RepID=UPI002624FF9C|nr:hypothetical protein [Fluviicola sp.]